jgi:hypothetical protein
MDPDFAKNTAGLYMMGGYVDRMIEQTTGDVLQADLVSDINLVIDPEAAKIALTADFPNITIVGNVANVITPTAEYLAEVGKFGNPFADLAKAYYPTFLPFWDETAAAIMVDPSIVTGEIECMSSDWTDWSRMKANSLSLRGCRHSVQLSLLWLHPPLPEGTHASWPASSTIHHGRERDGVAGHNYRIDSASKDVRRPVIS